MRKRLVSCFHSLKLSFLSNLLYRLWGCNFKIQKGNDFSLGRSVFLKCRFNITGQNNKINIKDDSFIEYSNIKIRGNNNTLIIENNAYANELRITIENDNNFIYIGENFFVCGNTHLCVVDGSKMTFGNGCMLSDNIEIRTTDNHAIYDIESGERINPEQDINIGDHVWIGMGATILKGVSIADGCIIGAKSIITKSIDENNCCVVGYSKIVRRNVKWTMPR